MGTHSLSIRRGGRGRKVALALVGTATAGIVTIAGVGVAAAAPTDLIPGLDSLLGGGGSDTTEVNEDLVPFGPGDTRLNGAASVDDVYGAPDDGGDGSLRLVTPETADKVQVFTSGGNAPLEDWVDVAAYSAFRDPASTATAVQFPSLQLTIDFNGAADGGFSTLTYEPVNNTDVENTEAGVWQRYEAGEQRWCSTREIPGTFAANMTQCSNGGAIDLSVIAMNNPDAVVTAFGFNQGTGNGGLASAVDLLTTPDTTFDFEPMGVDPVDPDPVDPGPVDPDPTDPGKDDDDKDHDKNDEDHGDKKDGDKKDGEYPSDDKDAKHESYDDK